MNRIRLSLTRTAWEASATRVGRPVQVVDMDGFTWTGNLESVQANTDGTLDIRLTPHAVPTWGVT